MQNNFKLKPIPVLVLVVFIIILVYFFNILSSKAPVQVLTPDNYPEGTTLSSYKAVPPGFPDGIILENNDIASADVVDLPSGKKQIVLSYLSTLTLDGARALYQKSLIEKGWKIRVTPSPTTTSILATLDNQELIITFTTAPNGTMATFQYEQK